MSISQADADEECLVFPAITKNYSEIKNTDGLSVELNNTPPNTNSFSRPLRSTLKTKSKFESEKIRQSDLNNSERNNKLYTITTRGQKNLDSSIHKIYKLDPMEKNGAMKSQFPTPKNDTEVCDSDQTTPCGSKEHLKRPSIQQLRKYSVVDPNTLKFVEG
uniref:PHB domain-containing protein n=1 Tax=Schistosoma mansoni TaxID=6183 RepID=A0A5K4F358_SCHMA